MNKTRWQKVCSFFGFWTYKVRTNDGDFLDSRSFFAKEDGQGLLEYALVLGLLAIAILLVASILKGATSTCREGFFYSTWFGACIPGYRP